MPLVVLFSVWLRHVLVAILTSIVQCTRHTAGFGNIILLSNVELFQHVKWRVFGCTVALFFDNVFWHCYSLGFRSTTHTIGFGNIILFLNAVKCGNRLPLNTMRTTLFDFLSSEMVFWFLWRTYSLYFYADAARGKLTGHT